MPVYVFVCRQRSHSREYVESLSATPRRIVAGGIDTLLQYSLAKADITTIIVGPSFSSGSARAVTSVVAQPIQNDEEAVFHLSIMHVG